MIPLKSLTLNVSRVQEANSPKQRDEYCQLRYRIFANELGWNIPRYYVSPESGNEDPGIYSILYDALSQYPVGAVRGVPILAEFPHRELFAHHECNHLFARIVTQCGTINGLAVVPTYRRSLYTTIPSGWKGSAGLILMISILTFFQSQKLKGCLLTAGSDNAIKFFKRLGFIAIDTAVVTNLNQAPLVNMALSFSSETYNDILLKAGARKQHQTYNYESSDDINLFIESRVAALKKN